MSVSRREFEQHPDADSYHSLPGLGVVFGARVLGEFGDDPDRYASAKFGKNYAGGLHQQALPAAPGNRLVGILHGCLRHHTRYHEHTAWTTEPVINKPQHDKLQPWDV